MIARDRFYRLLEIIPATLTWITFVGALAFSFIRPLWVVYFIIIFDTIWVFRVSYFVVYLIISWNRFRHACKINWLEKLQRETPTWERYWHVVFLPTYKEDLSVIRDTFIGLLTSNYPSARLIVVLAGEARDRDYFMTCAQAARTEFGARLPHLLVTLHPDHQPGEIPGKGSNLNWAGHEVKKYLAEQGIGSEYVIVSTLDIDTVVHPQYFAALTHTFVTHPDPYHASFQPVALYNNNIWHANSIMRIAAFGTTFWLLTELSKPERLFTFSSHAMSFRALDDVGFWEKDVVTEDSRIFVQCLLHYHGNYRVVPLYVPVSMDTVTGRTIGHGLLNLYRQQRRWAWGIEHFPYMVWHFARDPLISLRTKISYTWNLAEGMYSWATAPILIFVLGRLPLALLPDTAAGGSVIVVNTPYILKYLMAVASAGIILSVVLSMLLLPRRPASASRGRVLPMLFQWLLLPVTLILFGSIPATEAQTRLALGRRLGFSVTDKTHAAYDLH